LKETFLAFKPSIKQRSLDSLIDQRRDPLQLPILDLTSSAVICLL